jgi:hypothetical protein
VISLFNRIHKYHKNSLLGDFSATLGREGIFKLTTGNKNLHKIMIRVLE